MARSSSTRCKPSPRLQRTSPDCSRRDLFRASRHSCCYQTEGPSLSSSSHGFTARRAPDRARSHWRTARGEGHLDRGGRQRARPKCRHSETRFETRTRNRRSTGMCRHTAHDKRARLSAHISDIASDEATRRACDTSIGVPLPNEQSESCDRLANTYGSAPGEK